MGLGAFKVNKLMLSAKGKETQYHKINFGLVKKILESQIFHSKFPMHF